MKKFNVYYCNEAQMWADEIPKELCDGKSCSGCECGSGFNGKEEREFDAYRVTGLTPEEVGILEKVNGNLVRTNEILNRKLSAYKDAEEQGLLIKLPCKVGDTVYQIVKKRTKCSEFNTERDDYSCQGCESEECDSNDYFEINEFKVYSINYIVDLLSKFGKTVFLTREAAEAALKGANP